MLSLQPIISLLDSTIRISTPLIFCAMAGIFSRSGIIDIGLEGKCFYPLL